MSKQDQIRALRIANALRIAKLELAKVKRKPKRKSAVRAAVKSATTYKYRDPEKRRVYQRDLMRKRRKKK